MAGPGGYTGNNTVIAACAQNARRLTAAGDETGTTIHHGYTIDRDSHTTPARF